MNKNLILGVIFALCVAGCVGAVHVAGAKDKVVDTNNVQSVNCDYDKENNPSYYIVMKGNVYISVDKSTFSIAQKWIESDKDAKYLLRQGGFSDTFHIVHEIKKNVEILRQYADEEKNENQFVSISMLSEI